MPHKSHPEQASPAFTTKGYHPPEVVKAGESARTSVGQNSTQSPQPLQRSAWMTTTPRTRRVGSAMR